MLGMMGKYIWPGEDVLDETINNSFNLHGLNEVKTC